MYNSIKSNEDVLYFLENVNSLHDGCIIGVQYINTGIFKGEFGRFFNPEQTKLILKILVTSIDDAVVELEFENLSEWQIKDNQYDITDTSIVFNDNNYIVWCDDIFVNIDEMKNGSYVIAKSMKWRII